MGDFGLKAMLFILLSMLVLVITWVIVSIFEDMGKCNHVEEIAIEVTLEFITRR